MTDSTRRALRRFSLVSFMFWGLLAIQFTHICDMHVWAGSRLSSKSTTTQGDATRGQEIFNGKGVCYYCHGIDGNRGQRPQLAADTAALIEQLNPPPSDLRNRKGLRLATDKARFNAIRQGHPGTGMFPDTTMTTQELTDTLAYLAVLRQQDSKKTSKP